MCDRTALVVAGTTVDEYNILGGSSTDGRDLLVGLSGGKLLDLDNLESDDENGLPLGDSAFGEFSRIEKKRQPLLITTESLDVPLVILALILFILDIIFRNFVIKKKPRVKRQMTDEEQIASMRGR